MRPAHAVEHPAVYYPYFMTLVGAWVQTEEFATLASGGGTDRGGVPYVRLRVVVFLVECEAFPVPDQGV